MNSDKLYTTGFYCKKGKWDDRGRTPSYPDGYNPYWDKCEYFVLRRKQ